MWNSWFRPRIAETGVVVALVALLAVNVVLGGTALPPSGVCPPCSYLSDPDGCVALVGVTQNTNSMAPCPSVDCTGALVYNTSSQCEKVEGPQVLDDFCNSGDCFAAGDCANAAISLGWSTVHACPAPPTPCTSVCPTFFQVSPADPQLTEPVDPPNAAVPVASPVDPPTSPPVNSAVAPAEFTENVPTASPAAAPTDPPTSPPESAQPEPVGLEGNCPTSGFMAIYPPSMFTCGESGWTMNITKKFRPGFPDIEEPVGIDQDLAIPIPVTIVTDIEFYEIEVNVTSSTTLQVDGCVTMNNTVFNVFATNTDILTLRNQSALSFTLLAAKADCLSGTAQVLFDRSGITNLESCETFTPSFEMGNSDLSVLFSLEEDTSSDGCHSLQQPADDFPGWAIALIVVGGVLLAAAITTVLILKNRRLRRAVQPFESAHRSTLQVPKPDVPDGHNDL